MPEDKIPVKNPFSDDYEEFDFGEDVILYDPSIIQNAIIAEVRIETAQVRKETAQVRKETAQSSIRIIGLYVEQIKLQGEITIEERKGAISSIAYANFYQFLLEDETNYTEVIGKFKADVAFLKKELNIAEQEIQEKMNLLEK